MTPEQLEQLLARVRRLEEMASTAMETRLTVEANAERLVSQGGALESLSQALVETRTMLAALGAGMNRLTEVVASKNQASEQFGKQLARLADNWLQRTSGIQDGIDLLLQNLVPSSTPPKFDDPTPTPPLPPRP